MNISRFQSKKFSGVVFRNIFSSSERHALDDVCDVKEYGTVQDLIQITSGIDHARPQFERPFQYAAIEDDQIFGVFKRENWRSGRFGDGKSYGVWYGATKEETSVLETSWICYCLARDNTALRGEVFTSERVMYEAQIKTAAAIDLTHAIELFPKLVHPLDYSYCQTLGKNLLQADRQMLLTPSARQKNGVCTPLFSPKPIRSTQKIYYLKINVYPDGHIGVDSAREKVKIFVKVADLANPYGIS